MMKRTLVSILALLPLLASCAGSEDGAGASIDRDSAMAEIDTLRTQFEKAVSDYDMPALGALVSPEAVLLQPGSADWKAMQALANGAPFPMGAEIHITPFETVIMNEEWAYERGASKVTYADPETGDEIVLRDAYLLIFRNEGDGWKLHREVASASEPPEGWPAAE